MSRQSDMLELNISSLRVHGGNVNCSKQRPKLKLISKD